MGDVRVTASWVRSDIASRFCEKFIEAGKPLAKVQYDPAVAEFVTSVAIGDSNAMCNRWGTYDTAWRVEQNGNFEHLRYYARFCDSGKAYWIHSVYPSDPDLSIYSDNGDYLASSSDYGKSWEGHQSSLGRGFLDRALHIMEQGVCRATSAR